MAIRYYWTTAPADYDYTTCTTQLREQVLDAHGSPYRLVAIRDDQGGTFHEGQVPRYQSGLHAVWEAGSQDAAALGLPTLAKLGVATTARTPEQIVVEMDRLRRRLRALGDELTAATAARTTERTVDLDLDLDPRLRGDVVTGPHLCDGCSVECEELSPDGLCLDCEEEAEADERSWRSYGPDYWDEEYPIDGVGFANPGGTSALRASTPSNPRNLPCPTCGGANRLTPADVAAGYQCDPCADRAERGGW